MINREDVLQEALHKCFVEMYRWAQPSIDLDELIKNGFKDSKSTVSAHPLFACSFLYSLDIEEVNYSIISENSICQRNSKKVRHISHQSTTCSYN